MSADWQDALFRALASDVLFDEGVEAARNACVAGATLAAALITAAAYYDNPFTGAPALCACMQRLEGLELDRDVWCSVLSRHEPGEVEEAGFAPGFGFVSEAQAAAIVAACQSLVASGVAGRRCSFLLEHHAVLGRVAGPLNVAGLCALVFLDRGLDIESAERRFLLWRAEISMIEAERARRAGLAAFPFLSERYVYEGPRPDRRSLDASALMHELGLHDE